MNGAKRRVGLLVLILLAIGGGWAAVHRAMPAWYARRIYPLRHAAIIREAADRNGVDPALVAAIIYEESRFQGGSTSPQGAVGLMQVLPSTAQEIARSTGGREFVVGDLTDPRVNVLYGSHYLRSLLDRYNGSWVAAVAAYNAGQGNVDAWLRKARSDRRSLTVAALPFPETRAYVRDVLRLEPVYRRAYAAELGLVR